MNHKKIYHQLIEKAKARNWGCKKYRLRGEIQKFYTETHHIIPKCVGGDNSKKNLVVLSLKEHYICHLLLTRIYDDTSLIKAFYAMTNRFAVSGVLYEFYKTKFYDQLSENSKLRWTEDVRLNKSVFMIEKWKDAEYADKVRTGVRKYIKENPEEVARKTKILRDACETDEVKEKQRLATIEYWRDPESRKNASERLKELHKDPEWSARITANILIPKSEEHKRKIGLKSKEWMNRPEVKAKYSKRMSGGNNPGARKVINIKNGEIITSAKELSDKLKMNYSTVKKYLYNKRLDKIDWMWYNEYVEIQEGKNEEFE